MAAPDKDRPRVLAIDDSPVILDAIRGALADDFVLYAATGGKPGLQVAKARLPDIILLDVMMPEMNGFEVCRELKADPLTADIPVIFVTSLDSEGDELTGFEAGGVDFVAKPIVPVILRARVRSQAELARARKELAAANAWLAHERNLMTDVLHRMRHAGELCTDRIAFDSHTTDGASGDLIFSARRPSGDQHILVGDFTGHGLTAAVGVPLVSHLFYSMTQGDCELGAILLQINNVLHRQLPVNVFMAASAVGIPAAGRSATVWNCGAPDVLHRADDWRALQSMWLPFGVQPMDEPLPCQDLELGAGEFLYLMSDGPTELDTAGGGMLGTDGLVPILEACGADIAGVMRALLRRAADPGATDDMAIVRVEG